MSRINEHIVYVLLVHLPGFARVSPPPPPPPPQTPTPQHQKIKKKKIKKILASYGLHPTTNPTPPNAPKQKIKIKNKS
jgi:hypothetical protein